MSEFIHIQLTTDKTITHKEGIPTGRAQPGMENRGEWSELCRTGLTKPGVMVDDACAAWPRAHLPPWSLIISREMYLLRSRRGWNHGRVLNKGLIPHCLHLVLHGKARRIVQAELELVCATRPWTHLVSHHEQGDTLATADVRARLGECRAFHGGTLRLQERLVCQ